MSNKKARAVLNGLAPSKRLLNKIDKEIEQIVYRRCSGIQINIMDIGKVFKAGHAAYFASQDLETAVVEKYLELRQN